MTKGSRSPLSGAALLVGAALLAVGCDQYRTAALTRENPVVLPRAVAPTTMERAIESGLFHRHWTIVKHQGHRYRARLAEREHTVDVVVDYDNTGFTIRYVSSEGLLYEKNADGTETIHRKYLTWIKNLEIDIQERVIAGMPPGPPPARAPEAAASPEEAAAPPAAPAAPAADGGP